jgi:hypothetical protein
MAKKRAKKFTKKIKNPYEITTLNIRIGASDIKEMRDWLKEIDWQDMDPEDIDGLSDTEIISAIKRYYVGGISQFIEDGR